MKADTHVHLFSQELWQALPKAERTMLPTPPSLKDTLRISAASQAELVLLRGWPFAQFSHCKKQNDHILHAMQQHPTIIRGFCTLTPTSGEEATQELLRCFKAGFSGLGELCPLRQNFSLQDPHFLRLCDVCEENGKPINLYTRFAVGHASEPALSPQELLQFLHMRPGLRVLLSHYGAGLPFYALMPEVSKQLANVWFDTAPDHAPFPPHAPRAAAVCLGRKGLVHGSNLPFFSPENTVCPPLPAPFEELLCQNNH